MSTADDGGVPPGSSAPGSPSPRRATSGTTAPSSRNDKPADKGPLRRVSPMRDTVEPSSSSAPTAPVPVTRRPDAAGSGGSGPDAGSSAARPASEPGSQNGRSGGGAGSSAGGNAAVGNAAATQPVRPVAPRPGAQPQTQPQAQAQPRPASARRVRLTVSRVDPWSAMKISFLLSVALGIAGVVMVSVLWTILNGMGVFDQVNGVVGQIVQDNESRFDVLDFVGFRRVVSLSIVIGVIDVILVTAIATLGAFLYNVSSALVGGLQLTLTDD